MDLPPGPDASPDLPPPAPPPAAPDVTPAEPAGTPEPQPPPGPVIPATSNENPVLPHSAAAGSARASVMFARVIDLAGGTPEDPAAVLAQILTMCQAALADVDRFVPDAMRQTAADDVDAMISGL